MNQGVKTLHTNKDISSDMLMDMKEYNKSHGRRFPRVAKSGTMIGLHKEAELVPIQNLTPHVTSITKAIIFKHQNTTMALRRCPSHHDTNQGHRLWEAVKFLRLRAWEANIWLWSTRKVPLPAVLGIHGKSPSIS
jgi:hypothetical protein